MGSRHVSLYLSMNCVVAAASAASPSFARLDGRDARRLPDVRPRAATLPRRRLGAAAPGSDRKKYEAHRAGSGWHSSGSGPAAGACQKTLNPCGDGALPRPTQGGCSCSLCSPLINIGLHAYSPSRLPIPPLFWDNRHRQSQQASLWKPQTPPS